MITTIVARKKPKWLSESTIEDLIPAFLAGGWNGNVEGDREAVERLSGCKYEEYIQRIRRLHLWKAITTRGTYGNGRYGRKRNFN